ncbi:hypothetical protein PVJ1_00054 [Psychrobacillus phage PVJ1]|nr:hypothetical protein PVJ1_00054 [Psychrobacillus phage PVJ1]
MGNAPANSFTVDYYLNNDLLQSMNVEYFNEYVTALKAADFIKIKESAYEIKDIIMQHVEESGGNTIQLVVNLKY